LRPANIFYIVRPMMGRNAINHAFSESRRNGCHNCFII
jgi:hypothetical protein